jgi:glucosamine kinase
MTMQNEFTIIGIDGGGSKTRGIISKNGETIATATAGTTRVGTVGYTESAERLLNVIKDLLRSAEIESKEIDAVVVGLAGIWLPDEQQRAISLLKMLARSEGITLNDLIVISDAAIALEGAFAGENGIVLIVGTGTIGIAKVDEGRYERCGGWGIELDDKGSGAWIGREGLTGIVRGIDGRGAPTSLAEKLIGLVPAISFEKPRTIVSAYIEGAFEYAALTPYVMECATNGDTVCMDIIHRAVEHLLETPNALAQHFNASTPIKLALMGGIMENDTLLRKLFLEKISNDQRFQIVQPVLSALDGAVNLGVNLIENLDV